MNCSILKIIFSAGSKLCLNEFLCYPVRCSASFLRYNLCRFQVYVRRAYIAYDLNCVQHYQLENGPCALEFTFLLPSSHPNRLVREQKWHIISVKMLTFMVLDLYTIPTSLQVNVRSPLVVRIAAGTFFRRYLRLVFQCTARCLSV